MRTTLDIDDDVLQAATALARARGLTAGQVLSELARKGLAPTAHRGARRNGGERLPSQPAGALTPTMTLVNKLRDDS
ncbi:MAG: CopG family transcriptional regulator [Vicinamibacterales bacterium]